MSSEPDLTDARNPNPRLAQRMFWCAIALGVFADPMLRNEPWGLGLAVWIAALAVGIVALARAAGRRLPTESKLWLALAVLFAAALSWHDADTVLFFDFVAMLGSLTMLAMSLNAAPVPNVALARLRDLFQAAIGTGIEVATGAVPLLLRDFPADPARTRSARGSSWRVARALLITVPIVVVFALMLRNADPLFQAWFKLPDIRLDILISHVAIAAVFAWIVAGWMRRAFLTPAGVSARWPDAPFTLSSLDIGLALGALAILFAAFVAVQVGWLFGGQALVVRTTGLTYAQYARRGFFELTGVAALVLPVLLVTHALVPADDSRTLTLYRRLAGVLILLLGAIMASAAARMQLYVHYYGLSVDRLYASAFMVWLAMVFAWFALTVLRARARSFAVGLVASGLAVLVTLNVMNPDALVARSNLARADAHDASVRTAASVADSTTAADSIGYSGADPRYLALLGGDAVPPLVDALTTPAESARIAPLAERCAAARELLRKWSGERHATSSAHWTQWNAARARAARAVADHKDALEQLACPVESSRTSQ